MQHVIILNSTYLFDVSVYIGDAVFRNIEIISTMLSLKSRYVHMYCIRVSNAVKYWKAKRIQHVDKMSLIYIELHRSDVVYHAQYWQGHTLIPRKLQVEL